MSFISIDSTDCGTRYSEGRLRSNAGYEDFPHIHTAMSFELRQIPRISSRIVKIDGHTFELWSPNSKQQTYLPGVCQRDFLPSIPQSPSARRYDGHVGKHDCLMVPQYYRAIASHWPFMRRPSHVLRNDPARVAFDRLTSHWESDRAPGPHGRLKPSYVDELAALSAKFDKQIWDMRHMFGEGSRTWIRRPAWANPDRFEKLKALRVWAGVVDLGISLQRSVREKEAWIRFYSERRRMLGYHWDDLRRMQMPEADDSFIGFWANGADEKTVLHLMAAKVPCFIVHEYPGDTPPRARTEIYTSFIKHTIVEFYIGDSNPYDRLAAADPTRLHVIFHGEDGRSMGPLTRAEEELRSSSVYLQRLPPLANSVAYYRPGTPLPAPASVPIVSPPQSKPQPKRYSSPKPTSKAPTRNLLTGLPDSAFALTNVAWGASGWNNAAIDSFSSKSWGDSAAGATSASGLPPPSAAKASAVGVSSASRAKSPAPKCPSSKSSEDPYAARPVEHRVIDSERFPWIVPPAVATPPTGKWQKWVLSPFRDGKAWLGKGAKTRPSGDCFFDRANLRELYIRDSGVPPGVIDDKVFGRPVPRYPFFYESGENASYKAAPHRASFWMYKTRAPKKGDVGQTAREPAARLLPRLPDHPARDSAGQILDDPAPRMPEPDDDASEYGGAESDSGNDKPDRDPPSGVLCVSGIRRGMSAVDFAAVARDAFFHARARPQLIVSAEQQMWIKFETVGEARRAERTLIGLGKDLALNFGRADRFMRAWDSSNDRWTPETMADLDDGSHSSNNAVAAPAVTSPALAPSPAAATPFPAPVTSASATLTESDVPEPGEVMNPSPPNELVTAAPWEKEYPDLFPGDALPLASSETRPCQQDEDVIMTDANVATEPPASASQPAPQQPFRPSSEAQRLLLSLTAPHPLLPPRPPSPATSHPSLMDRIAARSLAECLAARPLADRLTDARPPLTDRLTHPAGLVRPQSATLEERLSGTSPAPAKKRARKLRQESAPVPPLEGPLSEAPQEETRKRGGRGGKRNRRSHQEAEERRERRRMREEEARQAHLAGIAARQNGDGDELIEMADAMHVANAEEALGDTIEESKAAQEDVEMDGSAVWALNDDDDPPIGGFPFR
ncbi:hypothetical protein C8R43DRAFT_1128779 [Mycena crocata]|nr:hypothetical protein C8R43DRAFT_1128779 [Mycena crocata]